MAVSHVHYTTAGFWILLIGVILVIVSSFGVDVPVINLFQMGVGLSFASLLVRPVA